MLNWFKIMIFGESRGKGDVLRFILGWEKVRFMGDINEIKENLVRVGIWRKTRLREI